MSIHIRIPELMARFRMTQRQLSQLTGIRPNMISSLYHDEWKRIDREQINRLCAALKCTPGELFEYISDNDD